MWIRHHTRYLIEAPSFNSYSNPLLLSLPFYGWRNKGSKRCMIWQRPWSLLNKNSGLWTHLLSFKADLNQYIISHWWTKSRPWVRQTMRNGQIYYQSPHSFSPSTSHTSGTLLWSITIQGSQTPPGLDPPFPDLAPCSRQNPHPWPPSPVCLTSPWPGWLTSKNLIHTCSKYSNRGVRVAF